MAVGSSERWYEESFSSEGFSAQRKYPNEELSRFMGRNFFSIPPEMRKQKNILEVGCGSGANLCMIAREGFNAYGIDFSPSAIGLAETMLRSYGVSANLSVQNMLNMSFSDEKFDGVVDIFSSYCLNVKDGLILIKEIHRLLKKGGVFFSYFPSKSSDAFKYHAPASMIDGDTLDGIHRETSPFFGNNYPFRFMESSDYKSLMENNGFSVKYLEKVGKTYRQGGEYFEWIALEAIKL